MKLDKSGRRSPRNASQKSRVLVPLLAGSIALHLLIWWAIAQFPAPPAKAPETLMEVQLNDVPAPEATPKAGATPAARPKNPRLAQAPRAPKSPIAPPTPPAAPNPPRRAIAPTAPLERSTRAVSETGIIAKKPPAKSAAPLPTTIPLPPAISRAQNPIARPQPAPDEIAPQPKDVTPRNAAPADRTQPEKPEQTAPTPNGKTARNQQNDDSVQRPNGSSDTSKRKNQNSDAANESIIKQKDVAPKSTNRSRDLTTASDVKNAKTSGAAKSESARKPDAAESDPFGLGQGPYGIGGGKGTRPNATSSAPDLGARPGDSGDSGSQRSASGGKSSASGGKSNASGSGKSSASGGKSSASGGGPFGLGDIAQGGTGEGPRRIVYILDVSYSMEPRFERAKQELRDALGGLQPGESFNIIAFYGNTRAFEERLIEATPRNIAEGRAFINSLRLSRYTNLERAFEKAFAAPGVNVVVLITDGVPTYGLGSPDFSETGAPITDADIRANFGDLTRRVRELNGGRARIYTVGLAGKRPDGTPDKFEAAGLLQRLAADSGGNFKIVGVDAEPSSAGR